MDTLPVAMGMRTLGKNRIACFRGTCPMSKLKAFDPAPLNDIHLAINLLYIKV